MRSRSFMSCVVAVICAAMGCHEGGPAAIDLAAPDMAFPTAVHLPLPQLPSQGGAVLSVVNVVSISYAGYPFASQTTPFLDWLVQSDWLRIVGAEYGAALAPGTHQHVELSGPAPASASTLTIPGLLKDLMDSGQVPRAPAGDPGKYVYLFLYPPETTIPDAFSCVTHYAPGYHSQMLTVEGSPFAVVGACAGVDAEEVNLVAAHEVIEAATDPFVVLNPAYRFDAYDLFWQTGGEAADLCDQPISSDGHKVPRVWSNIQAATGGDPCLPASGDPYFNVAPESYEAVVDAGGEVTIALNAWSTGPTEPWALEVYPGFFSNNTKITTMLDTAHVQNGDVAHLTVQVPASARSKDEVFLLVYSHIGSIWLNIPIRVTVR